MLAVEAHVCRHQIAVLQPDEKSRHDKHETYEELHPYEQCAQCDALFATSEIAVQCKCGREGGDVECRIERNKQRQQHTCHNYSEHYAPMLCNIHRGYEERRKIAFADNRHNEERRHHSS